VTYSNKYDLVVVKYFPIVFPSGYNARSPHQTYTDESMFYHFEKIISKYLRIIIDIVFSHIKWKFRKTQFQELTTVPNETVRSSVHVTASYAWKCCIFRQSHASKLNVHSRLIATV